LVIAIFRPTALAADKRHAFIRRLQQQLKGIGLKLNITSGSFGF
jgi:hypothetical protein